MILPGEARAREHLSILDREVATADRIVSDLFELARVKSASRSLAGRAGISSRARPDGAEGAGA